MSEPAATARRAPAVWTIVRGAWTAAPPDMRRSAWAFGAMWAALVALQALDSSDTAGLAGLAEFFSAVLGATGGLLTGAAVFLQASAKRQVTREVRDEARLSRAQSSSEAIRGVLVAVPVLAVGAATLLAAAMTLMMVRAFLGTPFPFVLLVTTLHLVLLLLAGRIVLQSARTLYVHAAVEAGAAAGARAQAREAELAALQARMNPHFLFNALNTVAALIRTDAGAAERSTGNLATVLRMTLDRTASGASTVAGELEYARAYLDLEQARWGDRLRVDWRVSDLPGQMPVLPLVLQPLLENALRHGFGSRAGGGLIIVEGVVRDGRLTFAVEDDGAGFPARVKEGTGLGNLRERLASRYGSAASLEIERPASGARVIVSLPCAS